MVRTIVLMLIGIFVISCAKKEEKSDKIQIVKIFTAHMYGEESSISFPGKVKAASDVNMAFRISGPISKVNVEVGSYVKAGDVLAEIDSRDYVVQLSATEAEYEGIKAEAERVMALYEKGGVTPNDYDKAVYGLQQITAKYEAHKNALADTKLRAKFDGYIQKRFFEAGETVAAGMPVLSMISSATPEVEINIPSVDYIRIDEFDELSCAVDIYPSVDFMLSTVGVAKKANLNQLYTMRMKIVGNYDKLPSPGMTTNVTIKLKKNGSESVSIPVAAVFEVDNVSSVWVYNESSNTVERRAINIQQINTGGFAIVSKGLKVGDVVVSAGVQLLKEGQKVRPLPEASSTNVGGVL